MPSIQSFLYHITISSHGKIKYQFPLFLKLLLNYIFVVVLSFKVDPFSSFHSKLNSYSATHAYVLHCFSFKTLTNQGKVNFNYYYK